MDIQHLHEFTTLAEIRNYQTAAYELHISQSALSKHIRRMEQELNVTLFDRNTRNVTLSVYGFDFYNYACKIVSLYDSANARILALRQEHETKNNISIGFYPHLTQYGIFDIIVEFKKQYPDINVEIKEYNDSFSKHCSFVFEHEVKNPDALTKQLVFKQDKMVVVFPEAHPLANCDFVTIDQLKNEEFIERITNYSDLHNEAEIFRHLCHEHGFAPKVVSSSVNAATVATMVSKSYGCAVMYQTSVPNIERIKMVNLYPEIPYTVNIVWKVNHKMNEAELTFLSFIKEKIAEK